MLVEDVGLGLPLPLGRGAIQKYFHRVCPPFVFSAPSLPIPGHSTAEKDSMGAPPCQGNSRAQKDAAIGQPIPPYIPTTLWSGVYRGIGGWRQRDTFKCLKTNLLAGCVLLSNVRHFLLQTKDLRLGVSLFYHTLRQCETPLCFQQLSPVSGCLRPFFGRLGRARRKDLTGRRNGCTVVREGEHATD
jgi:hypothetical protein